MIRSTRRSVVFTLAAVLFASSVEVSRADWTRFRGPNGSGISKDKTPMPVAWTSSANLKWKTKLPGPGVSSPIVVGDRVYVTCYSGYGLDRESPGDQANLKRHLVSIDRKTGKTVWTRVVNPVLPDDPYTGIGVTAHGYASSTPVSDGTNVYVFFGKTGVLAFDVDGKRLWQTSVGTESDPRHWGSASSPILYKNLLIVPATAESEAIVALDTKTGKEVWRQEATGFANSWATPVLAKVNDTRSDLVIGVTQEVWGLNPDTGKLRWYAEGAHGRSFCSSPVSDGDVVYTIEGQTGVSIAVRAGGSGDVTKSHQLWTGRDSARFGSPIAIDGRIYSFANGVVSVIDEATGERTSRSRLEGGSSGNSGTDFGSPILADGKLYMVRRSGETFVLKASAEPEVLAINRVTEDKEDFSGSPAASGGELFIRSDKHLYCISDMGQDVPKTLVASRDTKAKAHGAEDDNKGERGAKGDRGGNRQRRGNRGQGAGRRRGGFDPAAMFKQRDANGDGKLSGDELPDGIRSRLAQMDSDKDEALSLDEFRSGLRSMFGAGGRAGGGGRGRGGAGRGRGGAPRSDKSKRPQRPELDG